MIGMENNQISDILEEIANMLSVDETPTSRFEIRAYKTAALTISTLQQPVSEIYAKLGVKGLMELPGIGKGIAGNIEELLNFGRLKKYDELKKKYPIDFKSITKIEGIGAKKAVILYKKLGITSIENLKEAVAKHKIRELDGFGERSEEQMLNGIKMLESSKGRILLGDGLPVGERMVDALLKSRLVEKAEIAGSARRMRETIGDLDILVTSNKPKEVMEFFVGMKNVSNVIANGDTKSTVWLDIGISCDIRVIPKESFGAAEQYFIGSKDHNVSVRKIAIKKGYKLNEYGLFDANGKNISSVSERDIYKKLGLEYVSPEMRENRGEIELAEKNMLPKIVNYNDLLGDMHTHTKETDGINSIEEMAEYAMKLGREYIATTNHTKSLKIANGMNDEQFKKYFERVDVLNKRFSGRFRILKGAEVEILKDGSLDLNRKTLEEMDCVIGAIHMNTKMETREMTDRMICAIESGLIHIIAHPTGRIINERDAYAIDIESIASAAHKNNVALEINAYPSRLDLNDTNIMLASKYNVMFSIGSDAHKTEHMELLRFGIGTARRGWLTKDKILNTNNVDEVLRLIKK